MTAKSFLTVILILTLLGGCASAVKKSPDFYNVEIDEFSSSIKLLLTDLNFLKQEILKVNAKRPSIQRILSEADSLWSRGKLDRANAELERGLRLAKDESALYLRLSHLRLEQGFREESKALASRGLLNKGASSWEILLLNIYSKEEI